MIKYIFTLACVWASTLGAPDVSSLSQAYAPPNLTPSPLPLAPSSPKPMKNMDDLPICFPKTHFVTLTSTQVVPSLVYNTRTLLVPTTISQDVTKWNVWTSTEFVAQTLTSFPKPVVVTRTELLTATKYVTQAQFFTETSYVTSTESKFFTETLVATDFTTKTLPVTTYDTFTSTYYSTKIHRHTDFVTTTQYKHVTQTERHPHYLTQTLTSQYRVYETVTQTVTQNEYVTETSLHFQTNYVSKCSPKAQPTHYGGYGY